MRHSALVPLLLLAIAAPAAGQLNTYYRGTQVVDGKEIPATAQFSIEKGRIAMILKGARSARMIFVESDHRLRVIDDETKSYFDLDRAGMQNDATSMMAQAQKQMEKLPPDQRAMAEKMMQGALSAQAPPPTKYVWSQEKKTIGGYDCTRVDVMRGDDKRAEYWGTTSKDFTMSDAEHKTILAMQDYLRNFLIMVQPAGGGSGGDGPRAFQWDTSVDGYPVVTRCFDNGQMTLDMTLASFDRKALAKDLFETPSGYKKQDVSLKK